MNPAILPCFCLQVFQRGYSLERILGAEDVVASHEDVGAGIFQQPSGFLVHPAVDLNQRL